MKVISPSSASQGFVSGYACLWRVVGMLLLFGALMKGYELATGPVAGTSLLTSRWFLVVTVEFELLLGLCLWAGIFPRITWWVTLISFAGFASITANRAWIGEGDCGCFGRAHVNPRITLVIDLVVVWLLVLGRPNKIITANYQNNFRYVVAGALILVIGMPGGWLMASAKLAAITDEGLITAGTFIVLEPKEWVNKRFPLFSHIDIGERLKTGKWFVVLYSNTCSHCMDALPRYAQVANYLEHSADGHRVALVQIPPVSEHPDISTPIPDKVLTGQLDNKHEWFAETPVELELDEGVVVHAVSKGEGLSWLNSPRGK